MGFFDKIKKGFESAVAYGKMDDFLIEAIDKILSSKWQKMSEKKPANVGGISLEEEAEYKFTYDTGTGTVYVEMEHEWPHVEVEMQKGGNKIERKLVVGDYVEKQGKEMQLKNEDSLKKIIEEMVQVIG